MNYNGFAFGSEAERVASESLATFYVVRIYKLAKISYCIQKKYCVVYLCYEGKGTLREYYPSWFEDK